MGCALPPARAAQSPGARARRVCPPPLLPLPPHTHTRLVLSFPAGPEDGGSAWGDAQKKRERERESMEREQVFLVLFSSFAFLSHTSQKSLPTTSQSECFSGAGRAHPPADPVLRRWARVLDAAGGRVGSAGGTARAPRPSGSFFFRRVFRERALAHALRAVCGLHPHHHPSPPAARARHLHLPTPATHATHTPAHALTHWARPPISVSPSLSPLHSLILLRPTLHPPKPTAKPKHAHTHPQQ